MKQLKSIFTGSIKRLKPRISPKLNGFLEIIFGFINNFSIRRRLIFFFLLLSLVPLAIVGFISYQSSKQAINQKIAKYSQKSLSQTVLNVGIKLQGIENISTQFLASQEYNKILENYVSAVDNMDIFYSNRTLSDLLQTMAFSNTDIYAIMFMSKQDPARFTVNGSISSSGFFESFPKSDLYRQIYDANGKVVWSPVKLVEDRFNIMMAREIKVVSTGESLGILAIFIDETALSKTINSVTGLEENGRLDDDYSMIIDNKGVIISSPFKEEIDRNLSTLLGTPGKLKPLLSGKKERDIFENRMKGQNVLITCWLMRERGWSVLSVAKTSYLYFESRMVGWTTFWVGILFGIIAVFISLYIALSISNPLNQVVNSMRKAENGDFTIRAKIKRKDELGLLGASFDHMIEKIAEFVKETRGAIDAVLKHSTVLEDSSYQSAKTAEAVANAMEEISKGTMEQTSEAEKSSVKMTDLAGQIEVVVSKANEVEKISGSTRELSLKSKEAVEQLIIKTNQTDQITETIIKDIIDLNVSAEEIRGITEVISNIAEQTNLLALNAAIEAARAGEMGQGFAVVAEEVNKLAIQSRDAAKTINNILKTIQVKTKNSGKTAEEAHQIIEEQREAVRLAQQSFEEITTATGDIIGRIIFMNHLINNINNNKNHTVQSIVNIGSISEQTAASAQEVSASSEEQTALAEQVRMLAQELRKKAEELADFITKFKL